MSDKPTENVESDRVDMSQASDSVADVLWTMIAVAGGFSSSMLLFMGEGQTSLVGFVFSFSLFISSILLFYLTWA